MKKSMGMGGCVASMNIWNRKGKLKWCIKEEGVNPLDNGWRFLSDIDTDEYLADTNNMAVFDWGTIFEIEPAIMPIFDMPVGTELELKRNIFGKKWFVDCNTGETIKF